jgi:hypothetical protein
MRRLLVCAVGTVVFCLGCEKKDATTDSRKDLPPRMAKPSWVTGTAAKH